MYKQKKISSTNFEVNNTTEGETIEQKIQRVVNNGEPITDGAPLIYTERKDGVLPGYDIRTDRFDVAIDAMDKVSKTHQAKREERIKAKMEIVKDEKSDGGAESTQGTTEAK